MKRFALDERYGRLFALLAELRGASVQQLHVLFFRENSRASTIKERTVYERLERLVDRGFLTRVSLPDSRQTILHLTEKGRTAFPAVAAAFTDQVRKPPTDDVACWAWQRAALWACLHDDGFTLSSGLQGLLALRRSLVDRQRAIIETRAGTQRRQAEAALAALRRAHELTPHFFWKCTRCTWTDALGATPAVPACPDCAGVLKQELVAQPWRCRVCGLIVREYSAEHPSPSSSTPCAGRLKPLAYLPYDLAFRQVAGAPPEVRLLLVDNPLRSVETQLLDLPLRFLEQPKLQVILRPSDDGSVFDPSTGAWAMKGRRFRALEAAFTPHDNPRVYPFWVAAEVLQYRPEVVLRSVRSRRRHAS